MKERGHMISMYIHFMYQVCEEMWLATMILCSYICKQGIHDCTHIYKALVNSIIVHMHAWLHSHFIPTEVAMTY